VAAVPDPFGGSEYIEALTDELEREARALIAEIDERGGAVAAIESGWVKGRIEDQAFAQQRAIERGESVIVGVNRYPDPPDSDIELQVVTHESEQRQIDRLESARRSRDEAACTAALAALAEAARDDAAPLLEPLRAALAARCTVGDVCGTLRAEWGSYDSQVSDGR
jgi:methylmalonyl-CoA mutase N-terminal domain/subunit